MREYGEKERKADFEFFVEIYDDLYKRYGHSYVVIKSKEILGVYEDMQTAISMTSEKYPIGTFIVQECNGEESGYTNYVSSWQLLSV